MYKGKDLLDMEPEERARAGLFMRQAPLLCGALPGEPSWVRQSACLLGVCSNEQSAMAWPCCPWPLGIRMAEGAKRHGRALLGGQRAAGAHAGGKRKSDLLPVDNGSTSTGLLPPLLCFELMNEKETTFD